ncbi:MAG: murein DD-endopeptidase [Psychromonas sp.]|jgi:murein DD-endopeptidase
MPFLLRLKALFKTPIDFVNNLPRKHFFALILLSVFLLVVSLVPMQPETGEKIYRSLELPERVVVKDEHVVTDPLDVIKTN